MAKCSKSVSPPNVYNGEEINSLVFDLGSRSFRVGYAQDEMPKADIPTAVGVSVTEELEAKSSGHTVNRKKKYFTDSTLLCNVTEG